MLTIIELTFCLDIDRRLCLDNGISGLGFHDGTRDSVILLWPPKPGYCTLFDMAEYDDHGGGHYPGMF